MNLDRLKILWLDLRDRGLIFGLIAGGVFLVYLRTLAPGILPGDGGEFQFAAWGWTLAHPTGYPLYLLVGGLWQHLLPLGTPAFRLNLFSALCSALTIGLLYRILFRVTERRGAALVGALALAVSSTFWSQATESEVYALNNLFIVLLIWLGLRWERKRDFRYSAAWALVFGLSLAHHRSIILLIPGFAAFFTQAIIDRAHHLHWKNTPDSEEEKASRKYPWLDSLFHYLDGSWFRRDLAYVLLVGLPLLLYIYIPLRAGATPYARLQVSPAQTIVTFQDNPAGWLAEITGNGFQSELSLDAESAHALAGLPQRILDQFNPLGVTLGILGLMVLLIRRRIPLAALTLFGFGATVLFSVGYHIGDIADYYTPAYIFFAIWIAIGLGGVLDLMAKVPQLRVSLLPVILLLVAIAALPLQNFFSAFVAQDRSLHNEWDQRWHEILNSGLPPNSILVSNDRDEMTPMWYLQIVEGLRPDTLGLFPLVSSDPAYANTAMLVSSITSTGRPVFFIKPPSGLDLRYQLDPVPPGLYRLVDLPPATPQNPSEAVLGDKLRVVGYDTPATAVTPGATFPITIFWRSLAPLEHDYTVSAQVLDERGSKVAQGDDHVPGGEIYPPSLWRTGETLQDHFSITLPITLEPGLYHLALSAYINGTDETLGDLTQIGDIQVVQ